MSTTACFCTGPQNGEPLCRCAMRNVTIINGRYVKTQDIGPAPNGGLPKSAFVVPNKMAPRPGTRVRCPISGEDLGPAD